MAVLHLKGDIIPNDYKWVYDWFELESTCPKDAEDIINEMKDGEELEVYINSPGGDVASGMELYSLLSRVDNATAYIDGFAASAAGVAAMGCSMVSMTPVSTIMIHNVWCGGVSGDYHDMDKASKMLKSLNASMASAYVAKSGKDLNEVLNLMDKETWITAEKAVELGFADEVTTQANESYLNAFGGLAITKEMYDQAVNEKAKREQKSKVAAEILADIDDIGI